MYKLIRREWQLARQILTVRQSWLRKYARAFVYRVRPNLHMLLQDPGIWPVRQEGWQLEINVWKGPHLQRLWQEHHQLKSHKISNFCGDQRHEYLLQVDRQVLRFAYKVLRQRRWHWDENDKYLLQSVHQHCCDPPTDRLELRFYPPIDSVLWWFRHRLVHRYRKIDNHDHVHQCFHAHDQLFDKLCDQENVKDLGLRKPSY